VGFTAVERIAKIITTISLVDFELSIGDVTEDVFSRRTLLNYGQMLPAGVVVDYDQKLNVVFKLKNQIQGKPVLGIQQSFLKFSHVSSGHQAVFVAKSTPRQYQIDLPLESNAEKFDYLSGKYEAELIVGDAFIQNPFSWKIGLLDFNFPPRPGGDIHKIEPLFLRKPPPEIIHQFRQPEKRPPEFISIVFTILCVSPLFILFFGLLKIGANIRRLSSGIDLISAFCFQVFFNINFITVCNILVFFDNVSNFGIFVFLVSTNHLLWSKNFTFFIYQEFQG